MNDMTSAASASYLTREFDDFLFARLNEDSDDMPLSVLSVLARLGVDPWQEGRQTCSITACIGGQQASRFD